MQREPNSTDELDDIEGKFDRSLAGPTPIDGLRLCVPLLLAHLKRLERTVMFLQEQLSIQSDLLCGKSTELESKPGLLHVLSEIQRQQKLNYEAHQEVKRQVRKLLWTVLGGIAGLVVNHYVHFP